MGAVDDWGITDGYHDVHGEWHDTPPATRDALRAAMGAPEPGRPMWFVEHGSDHQLWGPCRLVLEDGTDLGEIHHLGPDTPLGYHELHPHTGGPPTRVVVHPAACPPIPEAWGVAAQIYALWSDRSWGIGDLRDLRVLAERLVAAGGSALLTSPLHQPASNLPQEASPYYPSSRRAWNPLLLAIDAPPPDRLRCHPDRLIDRDDVWIAKRSVLEAEFEAALDAGLVAGEPDDVAWWNAGCDVLQADWRQWPADEVLAGDTELEHRARFHHWLQGRVGRQLEEVAATGVRLIGDLAVGFSPNGADAHRYRDLLALDMRIGAPPDEFNTAGQDWGIPPFVPWKLRAALYEPFIDTVRACLRGVHGLRIDHVMGLFRQYWVPAGGSPTDGAYVRFPSDELLAILSLEATRVGAFVVGEDLGTVEPGVRETLAAHRIAGTRVLWFEDDLPSTWPTDTLATVTTHDLPTVTQVFVRVEDDDVVRGRLMAVAPDATTPAEAITAANDALIGACSRLRLVTTDDLAGATDQPNLPGMNDHPNWRLRLPCPVDALLG
jgi:4-alpha-glucanotransferase